MGSAGPTMEAVRILAGQPLAHQAFVVGAISSSGQPAHHTFSAIGYTSLSRLRAFKPVVVAPVVVVPVVVVPVVVAAAIVELVLASPGPVPLAAAAVLEPVGSLAAAVPLLGSLPVLPVVPPAPTISISSGSLPRLTEMLLVLLALWIAVVPVTGSNT